MQRQQDVEILIIKLMDWLLYNHEELKTAIEQDADYNGLKAVEFGDGINIPREKEDFISRFLAVIDERLQIIQFVQHFIYMLDADRFDFYIAKYCDHKRYRDIIAEREGLHISLGTIFKIYKDIRGGLWDYLRNENITLDNLIELRQKYRGIPGK